MLLSAVIVVQDFLLMNLDKARRWRDSSSPGNVYTHAGSIPARLAKKRVKKMDTYKRKTYELAIIGITCVGFCAFGASVEGFIIFLLYMCFRA